MHHRKDTRDIFGLEPVDLVDQHLHRQLASLGLLQHRALRLLERLASVEQPKRDVGVLEGRLCRACVALVGRVEPGRVEDLDAREEGDGLEDLDTLDQGDVDRLERCAEVGGGDDALPCRVGLLETAMRAMGSGP